MPSLVRMVRFVVRSSSCLLSVSNCTKHSRGLMSRVADSVSSDPPPNRAGSYNLRHFQYSKNTPEPDFIRYRDGMPMPTRLTSRRADRDRNAVSGARQSRAARRARAVHVRQHLPEIRFLGRAWTVTPAGATQQVGTSHVDVVSGGCALLENWRDARGGEGKSLNTYDPALKQWRQFWVGQQGGVTDYSRSEWNGSTISFFADVPAANGRPKATMRLSFTPLSHDRSSPAQRDLDRRRQDVEDAIRLPLSPRAVDPRGAV